MSEEQSNFKVTDRRLFNSDGSARDVPPEEKPEAPRDVKAEETSTAAAVAPSDTATASAAKPAETVKTEAPAPAQAEASQDDAEDPEEAEFFGEDEPASFANFIMSIASNAASTLGMIEHPVTGKRDVDLDLGKHWIDILGMLQQKTQGNLLPPEQQVLEGLLGDLRMQFVSLSNAAPLKTPHKFSGRDITGG